MQRVVIATSNAGKLGEFRQLLPADVAVEGLDRHAHVVLPEETGTTYRENAILKAEAACRATGLPSLGDDSGLEVAALDGRPGLYSARFAETRLPGESQDQANRRKLLEELAKSQSTDDTAKFVCALAFARPGMATVVFEGEAAGRVLRAPRGTGGFGYDPLLLLPEHGKTFAELASDQKNHSSHRGAAVAALLAHIKKAE